jgi:serine/threonine protein kinase
VNRRGQSLSGQFIDGFEIGPCLAQGGAAFLYECIHPDHDKSLLMKVPRLGINQPVAGLIGFETECLVQPRLDMIHAPKVYGVGALDEQPYIVMEAVPGRTLENLIATRGAMPLEDLIEIGAAIARALHAIHRAQVIHLDVKPANMILHPDGHIVLLDFGFAHHAQCPDLFYEAQMKGVGSPVYIAPEQILGARHDPRSDQFALGVTLFEMATGKLPFGEMEADSEMKQRLWRVPTPPRSLRPELPPWFQEVVLRCLEASPDDRFPSCGQVAWLFENPNKIELTPRRQRTEAAGFWEQARRWWRMRKNPALQRVTTAINPLDRAPIVLVALDPESDDEALLEALRNATRRTMTTSPESRLSCLSIITSSNAQEKVGDNESERQHDTIVALQHWASTLRLPENQLSMHVFEESDAAQRILSFAEHNHVDLIILGASHANNRIERVRSTMTRVVSRAHCSVIVVRPHVVE